MPDDQNELRARAFWSGTITFGLVSIPVNLFPGVRSQRAALRMLADDGTPLQRRFFCEKQNREVGRDEIVRGYETAKGKYVVITDDELEALEPKKSRDIDMRRFVPAEDIDPLFFERTYYLAPAGESTKAYRLLAETMESTKRAGIATFVMRGKEYLVAITAEDGLLRADTLRFADEIRSPAAVGLPDVPSVKSADVTRMRKVIKANSSAKLAEKELADEYSERIRKLAAKKERKDEDVYELPEDFEDAGEGDDDDVQVIDLVEVLKRSLKGGNGGARKTARKSARRKKAS
ncbi:MAG TPA: Ku protein [Longimicrobiales bacterium]